MLRFSKTFAAAASVELVVSIGKEFLSRRERERERERESVCVCGCERERERAILFRLKC